MKKSYLQRYFAKTLIAALLFLPQVVFAGVVVEEIGSDEGTLTVFRMTVTPAAEPSPALRYRLWLKPDELKPGNSVVYYLRAFPEGGIERIWKDTRQEFGEAVDEWYTSNMPIEELPLDKVRRVSGRFDDRIEQMILPGTMCRDADWGWDAVGLRGPEAISYLLPHVQAMRGISRVLALRTRLAIAEDRYEDAIETIRMNLRLGYDTGQELFLVSSLVGIAIEGIANRTVVDLIAAPESPNLYWALAEVPAPLVDCRDAVRSEMGLGLRIFPALMDAESAEHSPAEWAKLFREIIQDFGSLSDGNPFLENDSVRGFAATGLSLVAYPEARQRLIAGGMAADEVEAMPVGQVIAIDAAREYRRVADELEKWWYVSFADAEKTHTHAEAAAFEGATAFNFGKMIANLLLPAIHAARNAQMRTEWQRNALLTLEALRMHAAVEGAFPESLESIQVVPVPRNPVTGQPYVYRLEDGVAVLELPFSDGMRGMAWRFEMKLAEEE
jgi:hypothetical protein